MTGRRRLARGACAFVFALAAGDARAFLETGTLLTNSASATYSAGSQNTSVSYSATAKILVANPKVFLYKDASPTFVNPAGEEVEFQLCFSNGGANTAFNVTITDKLACGLVWVDGTCGPTYYGAWQDNGPAPYFTTSSDGVNFSSGCPPAGAGPVVPPASSSMTYLRWVVDKLDIGETGCVMYRVNMVQN
jgi:uncharacterized repeat protein (TIGR01451 family)